MARFWTSRSEIDQQVAAGNEVHAGERRVPDDAVRRKDAEIPDVLGDHVAAAVEGEVAPAALLRNALEQSLRVASGPGGRKRRLVDVGGEDLHARRDLEPRHLLAHENRDGVDLLTGRAAGDPHANGIFGTAPLEKLRNDLLLENLESLRVPEKAGDVDQKVAKEIHNLGWLMAQTGNIRLGCCDLEHLHAPVDTPQEGLRLVAREVVSAVPAQHVIDLLLHLFLLRRGTLIVPAVGRRTLPARDFRELGTHLLGR